MTLPLCALSFDRPCDVQARLRLQFAAPQDPRLKYLMAEARFVAFKAHYCSDYVELQSTERGIEEGLPTQNDQYDPTILV